MNCTRKTRGFGLGVLSATFALSVVGVAHAQISEKPVLAHLLPNCSDVAANATINITLRGAGSTGESISPDGGYISAGCKRYVVDVNFPNVSLANVQFDGSIVEGLESQAECEAAQISVYYFQKPDNFKTFRAAGGGTMRGNWVVSPGAFTPTVCRMTPTKGFAPKGFEPSTGDTWRVAVGGVIRALPVKVKVAASLSQVPH